MSGSAAEREIRDAVAAFARRNVPNARIVHELVVGQCRADIAAVARDRVLLFEVKSEKDTLDRLDRQMQEFNTAAHGAVLIAHRKWFDEAPYHNGVPRLAWPESAESYWPAELWCYPEPDATVSPYGLYRWHLPKPSLAQPHARRLLGMLWKAELLTEAGQNRVAVTSRMNMGDIISEMAWHMTGREIAEAVCRQLRARRFPEADEPIVENAAWESAA